MTRVIRDKKSCLSRLVVAKDGGVLTRAPCRIQLPSRWMDVELGSIADVTSVYGFFPILFDDNRYTVLNVCGMLDLTPNRTTKVTIQDEEYYEFHFDSGSKVIKSLQHVRRDTLTWSIFNEFFMKGKVPWWATLDDLCSVFDTADKHAGSGMGRTPETIEFLAGVAARKVQDRTRSLRQTAKTWDDYDLDQIEFVPITSVLHSVNSTLGKLSGSYFHEGVVSAMVRPASKTSKVEKILRA